MYFASVFITICNWTSFVNTCSYFCKKQRILYLLSHLLSARKFPSCCWKKKKDLLGREKEWFREKKDEERRGELEGGVKQREHARTHKRRTWRDNESSAAPLVSSPCTGCDDYPCRYTAGRSLRRCRLDRSWKRHSLSARILLYMSSHTIQRRTSSLIGCRLRLMELWPDRKWTISVPRVPIEAPVMAFEPCSCK